MQRGICKTKLIITVKLNPICQENEIYKCIYCMNEYHFHSINEKWKCPKCKKHLHIKIKIGKFNHSVQRIYPELLQVGEIITLENEQIHEILDIRKKGDKYRIALKAYKVIEIDSDSIVHRIEGGWY